MLLWQPVTHSQSPVTTHLAPDLPTDLSGKSIAVVRMSAIGDVVHTLPVVCSIHDAVPDARITWLIQPTPHQLIRDHPAVDEFILFNRRPLWRGLVELSRGLRDRRFDLVLDLHTSLKAGLATSMIDAPRKIGFDRRRAPELNFLFTNERIPPRPRGHVQEEMLEFLDHLEIPRRADWGIGPSADEEDRFGPLLPAFPGPTVAMVVASSLPAKDWPADRFAALVDTVADTHGARTIIVGGRSPAEDRTVAAITAAAKSPPLDLRAWDLRRLAYLIHRSDVLVSPDSGPLHIGVALGTPSVALMGYTNPKRVGPVRFHDLMIDAFGDPGEEYTADADYREGRMIRIGVDQVAAKVAQALRKEATRR